LVAGAD
jgi:hypothetical protein